MRKTHSTMHMHDILTIDTIVFEIVKKGRGGLLKPPPLSDRYFLQIP